ncbi:MAG: hypothetical protein AAF799_38590 [Myxococcota bacterium]
MLPEMTGPVLAMMKDRDKYPEFPPEFAVYCGWLVFGFVLLVGVLAWLRVESVRRYLLALDDPRTFAALRIGFALMTIACFLNLEPYWRMLWSDEGIFDLQYAQEKLGRTSLRGWSPDEGFFDGWSIANFLWHKPSLFYFWGSPKFVVGYMLAFFGVLLLYAAGFFSRTTGLIAWFMMGGIYSRNALYWEGTDTVYRCFWLILLFAKTGHAWSFDNWWRCRRLRKKGRLFDPDASPDEDQSHREPIYRRVPAWPRYLFMAQIAAIYITTGSVKTGSVWKAGDALYYALNMDHFYRFEWITQQVSAVFGTNLFRLNTWVTHWWERFFPLALIGASLRFTLRHRDQPWYRERDTWWRRWGARAVLVAIWGLAWRINYLVLPFCLSLVKDKPQNPTEALLKVNVAWGIIIPTFVVLWYLLGRWPVTLLRRGRALPYITDRVPWLYIPELHFNQETLRAYFLGRRMWLTLGCIFHGFLILFMNIGMFAPIMLMTYVGFLKGEETNRIVKGAVGLVLKIPGLKKAVPKGHAKWFAPAQAPTEVKIRGRRIPDVIVLLFGLMGVALIWAKIEQPEWISDLARVTYGWVALIAVTGLVFRFLPPRAADIRRAREPGPALAYTAFGRALALGAVVYHTAAVGLSLLPKYPILNKWRSPAASVFSGWLRGTGSNQSWRMFAPNPPRSNTFLKTVVVEHDGDRWDLRNNAFHYRPNPWIWNDRMRKMQRRMAGKGKWYLRYWAAWQCREWTLLTGEMPYEIEISKIITRIPPPDAVAKKGPYHPRKLHPKERHIQTHKCKGDGELPLYMLERYGLEITEDDRAKAEKEAERYERKFKNRRTTWDNRRDMGNWGKAAEQEKERRERAEERRKEREARKKNPIPPRIGRDRRLREEPEPEGSAADSEEPEADDEGVLDPKP